MARPRVASKVTRPTIGLDTGPGLEPPAVGTRLAGRYEVLGEIGRGGMGIVLRARDAVLGREVAVKVLAGGALDATARTALLREARAAAALNHPHIVSVYDVGEHDQIPFVVMELVPGGSLQPLPGGRLPPGPGASAETGAGPVAPPIPSIPETIDLAVQICEALDHAHRGGIVHRDLKPENVLVVEEEGRRRAKLADLGLAVSVRSRRTTEAGTLAGTVAYMSPEQALGRVVDGRSDLYSLGVLLYERTAGRLPFEGDHPIAIVSQHIHAPVVSPRAYNPEIPAALEQLILRLLAKDPKDRPPNGREVARALLGIGSGVRPLEPAGAPRSLDELIRGRLVGRAKELESLRTLWRAALGGAGHLALISGEPGIGKSRLARELSVQAQLDGATILSGGCYELEATAPYLPFVEAVRSWVRAADDAALERCARPTAGELARLAPELETRLGPLATPPPLTPNEQRLRLFDSVARFLGALAEEASLLVVLDDLHWADPETLGLLHYVLRQLRGTRVLFVGTYREAELDRARPLSASLVAWDRDRLATRLPIRRLPREETGSMISILLGAAELDDALVDAIHRESDGNPFFAEEIVKALIDQGAIYRDASGWHHLELERIVMPQSVKAAIGQRLDRVGESCTEVLKVAAVLGKAFTFAELSAVEGAVDGSSEDALLDALDEAAAAQLVAAGRSETFAFTHDKIRELLYEELNPIRRRRLHLRVARGLLAMGGAVSAADLAFHFLEGGDHESGFEHSLAAGREAETVYAYDAAARHYDRALECARAQGRTERRIEAGRALFHACAESGRFEEAAAHGEAALALAQDAQTAAVLRSELAGALVISAVPRGRDLAHEALAVLDPVRHPVARAHALTVAGRYEHLDCAHRRAIALYREALELAEPTGDVRTIGSVYAYLAGSYQHMAELPESDRWAQRCIEIGERCGDPQITCLGHESSPRTPSGRGGSPSCSRTPAGRWSWPNASSPGSGSSGPRCATARDIS